MSLYTRLVQLVHCTPHPICAEHAAQRVGCDPMRAASLLWAAARRDEIHADLGSDEERVTYSPEAQREPLTNDHWEALDMLLTSAAPLTGYRRRVNGQMYPLGKRVSRMGGSL